MLRAQQQRLRHETEGNPGEAGWECWLCDHSSLWEPQPGRPQTEIIGEGGHTKMVRGSPPGPWLCHSQQVMEPPDISVFTPVRWGQSCGCPTLAHREAAGWAERASERAAGAEQVLTERRRHCCNCGDS